MFNKSSYLKFSKFLSRHHRMKSAFFLAHSSKLKSAFKGGYHARHRRDFKSSYLSTTFRVAFAKMSPLPVLSSTSTAFFSCLSCEISYISKSVRTYMTGLSLTNAVSISIYQDISFLLMYFLYNLSTFTTQIYSLLS